MGNSQSASRAAPGGEVGTKDETATAPSEESMPGAASSSSSSSSVSSSSYASACDGGALMDPYYHDGPSGRPVHTDSGGSLCFPSLVPNLSMFRKRPNPLRVVHCHDGYGFERTAPAGYDHAGADHNDGGDDDGGYYHFDDAIRKQGKSSFDCCGPPPAAHGPSSVGFVSARSRREVDSLPRQLETFARHGVAGGVPGKPASPEGDDSDHDDSSACMYNPSSHGRRRRRNPSVSSSSSRSLNSNSNNPNDQDASPSNPQRRMFDSCYTTSNSKIVTTAALASASSYASFANCTSFADITSDAEWQYTPEEMDMVDGDEPTDASNLEIPRPYWIVTTAALPWMTGTACNPLLRAAYLSQRNRRLRQTERPKRGRGDRSAPPQDCTVTLVLPWLDSPEDRRVLYGPSWADPDKTSADQEAYVRDWLATAAHLPLEAKPPQDGGIAIEWYPARYHSALSSIFALGDLCEMIPTGDQNSNMICILEEPEHVNFYRAPGRESWRDKFPHVIGVVHTNYKAYARNHYSGILTGPLVGALSSLMVRAYCDKVVKLSPVLQEYAPGKEVVSNVHGIRHEFFRVPAAANSSVASVQCYFIGKLLWAKGLDKLLQLESHYRKKTGKYFDIDIVGSGPEQKEIQRSFLGKHQQQSNERPGNKDASHSSKQHQQQQQQQRDRHWRYFRQPIPARFVGRKDHAEIGPKYKVFVNPSVTEVLCTTTAEAIAMSKWVIVPRHASNEFFLQFPNCLQYTSKNEFVELLQYAMANPVQNVIGDGTHIDDGREAGADRSKMYAPLTWEAATQRLIDTAYLSKREAHRRDRLTLQKEDRSIQDWHYTLGNGKSGDVLRKVLGGGPVAEQSTYKREISSLSSPSSSTSLGSTAPTAAAAF